MWTQPKNKYVWWRKVQIKSIQKREREYRETGNATQNFCVFGFSGNILNFYAIPTRSYVFLCLRSARKQRQGNFLLEKNLPFKRFSIAKLKKNENILNLYSFCFWLQLAREKGKVYRLFSHFGRIARRHACGGKKSKKDFQFSTSEKPQSFTLTLMIHKITHEFPVNFLTTENISWHIFRVNHRAIHFSTWWVAVKSLTGSPNSIHSRVWAAFYQ